MKILLINSNRYKNPSPAIPSGLCFVAAALEQEGYDIRVLDLCYSKDCSKDMKLTVESYHPDVVGVSIRNIDDASAYNPLFYLEEIRDAITNPLKRLFKGPIVIGGASVGISGAEMLKYLDLEFAIQGDGEHAMVEFVRGIANNAVLDKCGGLIIRKNNKIIQNNSPKRVADLNTLPYFNPGKYIDLSKYKISGHPLQIQTKRGCALKCVYCTYNRIEGKEYRLKDPEIIAEQVERLVKDTGIRSFEFVDSTFNIPLGHCKDVLRAIRKKNLNLKLRALSLNPGAVDEELVKLMAANGFREVDLGVESGCDETLASLGKNFSKKDIIRAGKLLHENKIRVNWYLLVGAPRETAKTLMESFNTVNAAASKWDMILTGIGIRVYNGSPLSAEMISNNPSCTEDNFLMPIAYVPEKISLDEVKQMTSTVAMNHYNYFTWDVKDSLPPLIIMRLLNRLKRLIAPNQSLWRMYILKQILINRLAQLKGLVIG